MKKIIACLLSLLALASSLSAKDIDSLLPVRGFAIEAPSVREVDLFVRFIDIATGNYETRIVNKNK